MSIWQDPKYEYAIKVLAWRAISIVVGLLITYAFIGEWVRSLEMTIVFTVVMTILHYVFEVYWRKLRARALRRIGDG